MSNGSDELLRIALGGFNVFDAIRVTDGGKPVKMLNELEVVGNTLYANIWQTALIAVIDLPSGKVLKYLDFTEKVRSLYRSNPNIDVLNGIAYDEAAGRIFITGKKWPKIYQIELIKQ